jgi:chlorite dismutase
MHNPDVPETFEGWSVLHQMYEIDWEAFKSYDEKRQHEIAEEATAVLTAMEGRGDQGPTSLVQLLGHKGDLMLTHFRPTFDDLAQAELDLARTGLNDILVPTTSFVSVVELGVYELTAKLHREIEERGLERGSDEFEKAFDEEMVKNRERMLSRLFTEFPKRRQVCFYPMDKRRTDANNWYRVPFEKRAAMMREHGMIGRQYAGKVNQIISGSIGFDDWEWGVDLYADEPVVFKKLIYEMRFDEASALYAEFGPFYVGLQFSASELPKLLAGQVPQLNV